MIFACTDEHFHVDDCPHEFKMFWRTERDRKGHFAGSIWVCEQCLHRVDPPGTPPREKQPDIALFDLTEDEVDRNLDRFRAMKGGA